MIATTTNGTYTWSSVTHLMEQELLTLPENLSSSPVFSGVRVTRSLVLCIYFVDRCLSLCTFPLASVLSVLLRYTDSDYSFGIFWPVCCLFFFGIRILITPLVSFGQCVVCSSSVYGFWLLLWYLQTLLNKDMMATIKLSKCWHQFGH